MLYDIYNLDNQTKIAASVNIDTVVEICGVPENKVMVAYRLTHPINHNLLVVKKGEKIPPLYTYGGTQNGLMPTITHAIAEKEKEKELGKRRKRIPANSSNKTFQSEWDSICKSLNPKLGR